MCPPTLCLPDSKAHSACLCDCPLRRAVSSVQDARIQRVLDFLKAPSQLSDKDLAAKVCLLCSLPTTSIKLSLCSQLLSKCIYLDAFSCLQCASGQRLSPQLTCGVAVIVLTQSTAQPLPPPPCHTSAMLFRQSQASLLQQE